MLVVQIRTRRLTYHVVDVGFELTECHSKARNFFNNGAILIKGLLCAQH